MGHTITALATRQTGASSSATPTTPPAPGAYTLSTWADWDHQYRVVWTPDVAVADCLVTGSAIQFPDGRVGDGHRRHDDRDPEPPLVMVGEHQFTTAEARELAAAVVATADRIDGWVTR
ncbi:hypothetical protein Mkiyose1665_18280 [Mycobacterium kiyosense]|uniref:Uncharacterized protein n=1 Tax=Mycobacterium kiyosense TaxID=2871094 RepID=A0A9P3UYK0_9MYCO|nr:MULTISPECIES: hypothetical protein [Mycobacterium]BDB43325.1 hypothetical protein IWGMT90018_37710 [Mycobacterium kiyosense]BDE13504.1 hypothetical protein MKCMC460_23640 [Mycobacterium sp. 20KCMC460]GLB84158.1 hypothetical protein SRL2020028_34140 [Mycobacterium kiyosense]GLB88437.1 hypothetical protein SRL2020130_12540 [Mycobacterium kiyosense]GLB94638.1 hypothetical protein SRL2020226_14140 [Mycobacterium kiyosense]